MFLRSLICTLAALAVTACASGGSSVSTAELPPPDPVTVATLSSNAEYRVGPLDTLDVAVFQVPELSDEIHDVEGLLALGRHLFGKAG